MKLRSTLLFAAASLTASALAPVVATTSAFFAASMLAQAEDLTVEESKTISTTATYDAVVVQRTGGSGDVVLTIAPDVTLTTTRFASGNSGWGNTTTNIEGTMTVLGTATNGSSGTSGSFTVAHWSVEGTVNVSGTLNLNSGLTNVDGRGTVNILDGGVLNLINGLSFDRRYGSFPEISLVEGARVNIGGTGTGRGLVNASDGVVGILGANASTETNWSFSGDTTFDTTSYAMVANGNSSSATSGGGVITLNGRGAFENGSKMLISGPGKVVLGGTFGFDLSGDKLDGLTFCFADVGAGTLESGNLNAANSLWNGLQMSSRVSIDTSKIASEGVVSFSGEALKLVWNGGSSGTWEVGGTSNLWLNGTESSDFLNIDSVEFTDSTTNGGIDVASAITVTDFTVSSGTHTLTRSNGGYVVIGRSATVKNGGILILDTQVDGAGLLRGAITVEAGGTLQFNKKDVSGYDGGVNSLHTITINSGGKLVLSSGGNETFAGTLNLNGTLEAATGSSGNKWDIFKGNSKIIVSANANAKIAAGVELRLRRDDAALEIGENGTLTVGASVTVSDEKNGWFHKRGAGTLIFSDATLNINKFVIDAGTVKSNGTTSLGEVLQEAGTLNVDGGTTTISTFIQNAGMLNVDSGTLAITGNYVGSQGEAFSSVSNVGKGGRLVVDGDFTLRYQNNYGSVAGATLNVSGDASVGGILWIARDGKGEINITESGTLTAGTLMFGQYWNDTPDKKGAVVNVGGRLIVDSIAVKATDDSGTALSDVLNNSSLNLNGGSFGTSANSLTVDVVSGSQSLGLVLGEGTTSTINTSKYENGAFGETGSDITISNVISGGGALTVDGSGALTLNATNTYTGGTTISGGVLAVASSAALGTGSVVLAGGTLKGSASAVEFTAGTVVVAGSGSAVQDVTLNGATVKFDTFNFVNLVSGVTFTAGALDLSTLAFSDVNDSVTLFTGADDSHLTALQSFTNATDGELSIENGAIKFTVSSDSLFLEWDLANEDQTWGADSFSGKTFAAGRKALFGSADGEKDVTITAAVSSSEVVVDAGDAGTYDFGGSGYLSATKIDVRSGTLILNELSDSNTIGAVSVQDGASLVLNSDNSGFDSIILGSDASLVLKTNTAFRDANNATTGGAILGSGTIVVDLTNGGDVLDFENGLARAFSSDEVNRFIGTLSVEKGTVSVSSDQNATKSQGVKWVVKDGGRILLPGSKAGTNFVAGLSLAGAGLAGATDEEKKAAIAFTGSAMISADTTLSGDTTVYVAASVNDANVKVVGTFSGGWNSNGHTLTITGPGALHFGSSSNWQTAGSRFLFDSVSLASGATIGTIGTGYLFDNLILADSGSATLRLWDTSGVSTQTIGIKRLLGNNATLNLVSTVKMNGGQYAVFTLGDASVLSENGFNGKIVFSNTTSSGNRKSSLILANKDIAKNAEISLTESSAHTLGLGINVSEATIGGLSSTDADHRVFSGAANENLSSDASRRTLEIATAENTEYTFHGQILNNLNLVKSGAGAQVLAGASTSFDGAVSVTGGSLVLKNGQALGSTGAVSVTGENSVLSLSTADADTAESFAFANSVSGTGALKKEGAGVAKATGALSVANLDVSAGTLVLGADNSVGGLSGAGTLEGDTSERVLSLTGTANKIFSGTIKNLNITTSGSQTFTNVKWQGAEADSSYAGTLKVAAGTLTMSGENSGFAGKVEMAGGEIAGTLQLGAGTTLTSSVSGATTIANLTLTGGTVEWTKLHSEGEGATKKQWYSVGTLNLAGTESSVVSFKIADSLTPAGAGGVFTTYTLFEFDTIQNNGTAIASSDLTGKAQQDLFAALGGNLRLVDSTGADYGWGNIILKYVEGTNGSKSQIQIYQSALAQNLHWVGDGDAEGGWTQTDVWADDTETKQTFSSMSSVTLNKIDDLKRTITVSGAIEPASITVTGGDYTLKLAEGAPEGTTIRGSANLYVSGGTLTVDLSNTFNGGTQILAGATVNIGANSALGTGEVKLGGALNFKDGVTEFKNALSSYNDENKGVVTKTGTSELTLSGDRSKFTGTLDVDAGTVVLANGMGTEAFTKIDIAEGATVSAWGDAKDQTGSWGAYKTSMLALEQVSGAGTLIVNSSVALGEKTFFTLDLTGSSFEGTVELNAVDLVIGTEANFAEAKASKLADADGVRLANKASLNFFNDTQTGFAKNIEVAETDGEIRAYQNNTGVTISGNVFGAGTLKIGEDGGTVKFIGAVGTKETALGGLVLAGGKNDLGVVVSAVEISGSSINVSGDVTLSGASTTINSTGTIGGKLTTNTVPKATLVLGGKLGIGNFERVMVSGGDGRVTSVLEGAEIIVAGTAAFGNYENLNVGKAATFSTQTLTNMWGLSVSLAEDAKLSADELSLNTPATDTGRMGAFTGTGEGATVELKKITLGGDVARASFENVAVKIGADGIVGSGDGKFVQFKDTTVSVLGDATGWTAEANVKLNGGATTFDVGADEVITLNGSLTEAVEVATGTEGEDGYVAGTSSALIKTGAGTLVLGQANANKGGTQINGGVLKYTSSVTLGGEFAFGGGALAASGTSTVVSVGTGATLSGNVVLTSERSGKVLFTEDLTHTGSFTLDNGAIAEIAESKTLTLSSLTFTNGGSTLQGAGTLALAGTLTSANNRTNTISSNLTLSADSTLAVSSGTLKFTGENLSTGDYTLTKTGAGTLVLDTDAVYEFSGSLNVTGGKVDLENRTLTIGEGDAFGLQNATLTGGTLELGGTSADKLASATLGGGTTKIEGDVSIANTALTFGGKVTGIGELKWGEGNTVTLTDAFRATFSGTMTLLDVTSAVDADGNALTAETTFGNVFKDELFLGREVELFYNETNTTIDITVTGALQWNDSVSHWVQTENIADWEAAKWDEVTKTGLVEKNALFTAGKFVEFNKTGSITLVGTASRTDGTIYGTGPINTAGMIFNIADNGQFSVSAAYESGAEGALVKTYLQGVERTGENGEKTYVDDGITILAGNIVFDATVDNQLTGGMRIFGGELWVSNEQSLGDGTITLGDSAGTTAAKLGFNGGTTLEQEVIIGNEAVTIDVADGRGTVTISNALEKDATATTAKLTKAGAGTLVIQSGTALDGITVSGGKLTLADDGNAIGTKVFAVGAGATLNIANGAETGENSTLENSTLENLTLAGALTVGGSSAFRAGTISVVGDASITGNLYVGSGTSFKNGEKDVAGTLINVASGTSLALTGNVKAYDTNAALYKQGAGSLRFASNATLDADFVHSGGTVIVSEGLTATKSYTVDGAGTRIQINSGKSATFNNFAVTETGRLTVQINPNANAEFNGFAAADNALTVFAGTDINSVRTATINGNGKDVALGNGKDVALGNIEIGGLTKQQWLVNLTVNADKIKAGTVSLGAASTLKLATAGADATAKALVVESYQGQVSTLDLSSGATFKLENTENIAVLQGAGTLKVVGGTLSVKGQNYSSELSPKVLLEGATFNFEVTGDGTKDNLPVYSSLSAISTTEKDDTVSKSGTGTLVLLEGDDAGWFTPTSDMEFNGTIAANGGDLQVYATMSKADVAIAADGRLTVFAEAELGDSVDDVNTLAKKLSGEGTLVARGYLYANGGLDSFDGKLIAGGDGATDVGYLYVYNTTEAWLSSGAATRGVGVENGGRIFAAEADVALKAVSLTGSGALYGGYNLTTGEAFSLSVDEVNATSGSTLELLGTGTLGTLSFADAADGATATNTLALSMGDWTLNGASTNLTKVAVDTGMLTVANAGALGTADVSVSDGIISITADGQYSNAIDLSGDAAAVQALGKVDLSGGTLTSDATKVEFIAGEENADGTKTAGTLTLSETVFGLATGDITFNAVDGTIAVNAANAQTFKGKLAGAGTFEKTGAGTLTVNTDSGSIGTFSVAEGSVEFGSAAQLKAHGETTGTLSVANGASAKINGTDLSDFVLGGKGTVRVDGGKLAGMKDAKNVSVNAGKTLSVSGDISGSTVALNGATLKTNGTAAQTISGTTLSGATVTLSNENASAAVVYDSTVALSGTTTLVLDAQTGYNGGEFAGAYSGSLTKTGDGKWTVSNYTYGADATDALNVNGGTLEWKNANFGSNAGTISLGTGATLSVNGLASGNTLSGTVSGDATTTLEIKNSTLTLGTEAAAGSAWGLLVSGDSGTPVVTIGKALPGSLEVAGTATAKLALGSGSAMEMGENDQLTVAEGATLELASGTLTVANASKERLNTIDGNVTVAAGSTFAQNAGIRWNTGSTLDIEGTYSISVGDLGNTGWNKAKITGAGTLEIKNTSSAGYDISGEVSDFAGTLSVASGAKVNLTSGASFDDVKKVEIVRDATLEVAHDHGGTLDKLSGEGKVVINADSSKNNFPNAVYAWGTNNAGFSGNVAVKSGALAVSQADLTSLVARLSVGGEHVARYSESAKGFGIYQGAFLKVTEPVPGAILKGTTPVPGTIDVSVLGQNGGMILSGGEYVAGTTFGNAGKGNLYVVEKASTLKLAPSADVNGSLFVAYGATLDVGATGSVSMFRANGTGGNNVVNGDFTLNGTLVVDVDESNVNKTLVDVAGTTSLASGKQGPAKVEIYAADTTTDLSNSDITIFNNYKDTKRNLEDVVEVEVMGRPVEVSRDAKGNIVVVSAVNDYTAPSGLQGLYGAIRGKGTSALWSYLKSDRANAEMMDSKLVALSPVSYGSLVEMQSGFVALENDLLRDRLEQRRYERAFASNAQKQFKPFVNILGSQREGDGNGTESANYDVSHTGAIGGFDVAVSRNTIFGVSLGFDWAKADLHDGAGKHEGDTTRLGVYGMSVFENAYFGYGLSAGATSFDTKRNSGYNGETLTGSTDGNDVNASVIFGAGWTIDEQLGLDLAPYVGLDLGYAYAKSFTEEGGKQTALDIEKMERWSLRGKIGATLSWRASERTRISFDASFSHEFLDSDMDIDATFASGDLAGTAFSSTAYLMDENTISIGPRVDYRIDDTWSVSGGYSYETDLDDTVTHSANVGFRARF